MMKMRNLIGGHGMIQRFIMLWVLNINQVICQVTSYSIVMVEELIDSYY
jgi:hypothetical protein